ATDAPRAATRLPQAAPLRLLGQPGAPGQARAVPHPPGACHTTPSPGRGCEPRPQATRGVRRGARDGVSRLPTRAYAADHDVLSTASGVGPLCSRAWT